MKRDRAQMEIQEAVMDWFKDSDDELVKGVVNSFVYMNPAESDLVSKELDRFLKENGLVQAYTNYLVDVREPERYFKRASSSEVGMINDLRVAFMNLCVNRWMWGLEKRPIERAADRVNRANFNLLKTQLLNVYESLNSSEHYMDGESEDAELVKMVKGMKYERG